MSEEYTTVDFNNLNFVDGNILNAYELNILKQFVSTAYQTALTQLAINNIHTGSEPPTQEQYGEKYTNMLWIDTSDNAEEGIDDSTLAIIADLTDTVQNLSKQLEEIQRQLALIIAGGGSTGPISRLDDCLILEDGSLFVLEDGSPLKLEFASQSSDKDLFYDGCALAFEDGSIMISEDNYILLI